MDKIDYLEALTVYSKNATQEVPPPILDQYLKAVAGNGETLFQWPLLKPLILGKLKQVIEELAKGLASENIPERPNMENVSFDVMHDRILEAIHKFNGTPFTIQRLCELLIDPNRHYKRSDKYLRGLEKNVLVVSTVDPLGRKVVSESGGKHLVNGLDTMGSPFCPRDSSIISNLPPVPGWVTTTISAASSPRRASVGEPLEQKDTQVTMETDEADSSATEAVANEEGEEESLRGDDNSASSSSSSSEELSTSDTSDSSDLTAAIVRTSDSQSPWESVGSEGESKILLSLAGAGPVDNSDVDISDKLDIVIPTSLPPVEEVSSAHTGQAERCELPHSWTRPDPSSGQQQLLNDSTGFEIALKSDAVEEQSDSAGDRSPSWSESGDTSSVILEPESDDLSCVGLESEKGDSKCMKPECESDDSSCVRLESENSDFKNMKPESESDDSSCVRLESENSDFKNMKSESESDNSSCVRLESENSDFKKMKPESESDDSSCVRLESENSDFKNMKSESESDNSSCVRPELKIVDLNGVRMEPESVDSNDMRLEPESVDSNDMRLEPEIVDSNHIKLEPESDDTSCRRLELKSVDSNLERLELKSVDSNNLERLEPESGDSNDMRLEPERVDSNDMRLEPGRVDSNDMRLEPESFDSNDMRLEPEIVDSNHIKLEPESDDTSCRRLELKSVDSNLERLEPEIVDSNNVRLEPESSDMRLEPESVDSNDVSPEPESADSNDVRPEPESVGSNNVRPEPETVDSNDVKLEPESVDSNDMQPESKSVDSNDVKLELDSVHSRNVNAEPESLATDSDLLPASPSLDAVSKAVHSDQPLSSSICSSSEAAASTADASSESITPMDSIAKCGIKTNLETLKDSEEPSPSSPQSTQTTPSRNVKPPELLHFSSLADSSDEPQTKRRKLSDGTTSPSTSSNSLNAVTTSSSSQSKSSSPNYTSATSDIEADTTSDSSSKYPTTSIGDQYSGVQESMDVVSCSDYSEISAPAVALDNCDYSQRDLTSPPCQLSSSSDSQGFDVSYSLHKINTEDKQVTESLKDATHPQENAEETLTSQNENMVEPMSDD